MRFYKVSAICDIDDMESPEFHGYLAQIQDRLDPNREHDCGGFASIFFSGIEWSEMNNNERLNTVECYVAQQREWIKEGDA